MKHCQNVMEIGIVEKEVPVAVQKAIQTQIAINCGDVSVAAEVLRAYTEFLVGLLKPPLTI